MLSADATLGTGFTFFPPEETADERLQRMVRESMDFGTRKFVPDGAEGRVDPLERLLDPNFTEKTWYYEHSKIGDMPGSLHPKQIEALHNPAQHRWLLWGNQSGKTTLGAIDLVLKALGRHPLQKAGKIKMPPHASWASGLTWELWEKILLPELLTWIPVWRIIDAPPPFKHSTRRDIVIRADNGKESRITGKAAQQGAGAYQSARVDDIWLDEEHPEEVWDEMQPRLLRRRGRTNATMTPLLGFTWVHGRVYEPVQTGRITPDRHWFSHAGIADNPGIDKEAIESLTEELKHNPSQLKSRLYGHFTRPAGAVLPWDPQQHLTETEFGPDDDRLLNREGRKPIAWYGALDLGKWGFALPFGYADHHGQFTLVDEYFSQAESTETRAIGLTTLLKHWKVPESISIPADCADPDGIANLNAALDRIGSPYSVYAIEGGLKAQVTGILRLENMLNRGAFKVRRGMAKQAVWYLGKNAAKTGQPVMGSRWMWEAANWQYPKMPDGKVQTELPDDYTADGAHMMAASRYLVMKHFPADAPAEPKKHPSRHERLRKEIEDLDRLDRERAEEGTTRHKYGGVLRQG